MFSAGNDDDDPYAFDVDFGSKLKKPAPKQAPKYAPPSPGSSDDERYGGGRSSSGGGRASSASSVASGSRPGSLGGGSSVPNSVVGGIQKRGGGTSALDKASMYLNKYKAGVTAGAATAPAAAKKGGKAAISDDFEGFMAESDDESPKKGSKKGGKDTSPAVGKGATSGRERRSDVQTTIRRGNKLAESMSISNDDSDDDYDGGNANNGRRAYGTSQSEEIDRALGEMGGPKRGDKSPKGLDTGLSLGNTLKAKFSSPVVGVVKSASDVKDIYKGQLSNNPTSFSSSSLLGPTASLGLYGSSNIPLKRSPAAASLHDSLGDDALDDLAQSFSNSPSSNNNSRNNIKNLHDSYDDDDDHHHDESFHEESISEDNASPQQKKEEARGKITDLKDLATWFSDTAVAPAPALASFSSKVPTITVNTSASALVGARPSSTTSGGTSGKVVSFQRDEKVSPSKSAANDSMQSSVSYSNEDFEKEEESFDDDSKPVVEIPKAAPITGSAGGAGFGSRSAVSGKLAPGATLSLARNESDGKVLEFDKLYAVALDDEDAAELQKKAPTVPPKSTAVDTAVTGRSPLSSAQSSEAPRATSAWGATADIAEPRLVSVSYSAAAAGAAKAPTKVDAATQYMGNHAATQVDLAPASMYGTSSSLDARYTLEMATSQVGGQYDGRLLAEGGAFVAPPLPPFFSHQHQRQSVGGVSNSANGVPISSFRDPLSGLIPGAAGFLPAFPPPSASLASAAEAYLQLLADARRETENARREVDLLLQRSGGGAAPSHARASSSSHGGPGSAPAVRTAWTASDTLRTAPDSLRREKVNSAAKSAKESTSSPLKPQVRAAIKSPLSNKGSATKAGDVPSGAKRTPLMSERVTGLPESDASRDSAGNHSFASYNSSSEEDESSVSRGSLSLSQSTERPKESGVATVPGVFEQTALSSLFGTKLTLGETIGRDTMRDTFAATVQSDTESVYGARASSTTSTPGAEFLATVPTVAASQPRRAQMGYHFGDAPALSVGPNDPSLGLLAVQNMFRRQLEAVKRSVAAARANHVAFGGLHRSAVPGGGSNAATLTPSPYNEGISVSTGLSSERRHHTHSRASNGSSERKSSSKKGGGSTHSRKSSSSSSSKLPKPMEFWEALMKVDPSLSVSEAKRIAAEQ